ncbi:MAG: ABC transporter ATP-binding protein [Verrucomicrobiota bacterium]|nr:ABC transporter ATP-binding protein [Verrucomicrobiota bacterium]
MTVVSPTASETSSLVEVCNVSKWFGSLIALNGISLEIGSGITGLVGPNGAGKTTLLKLLTGQSKPSLGEVRICGHEARLAKAKAHVGFCPYGDATWDELSGRRLVRVTAGLRGFTGDDAKRRTESVLETVGMVDRADRPVRTYSKGMRQRIKLGQALIHDPDLLVLDEPLNGVDPVGREELHQLFLRLAKAGKAVLISSHILNEMDDLADHILFVCRGKLLASGSLETIRVVLDDYPLKVRVSCESPREVAPQLMALESVKSVSVQPPEDLFLEVQNPNRFYAEFGEYAANKDIQIHRLKATDTSAEALFDYLMERASRPK